MSKTKGLKKGTFWVAVHRRIEHTDGTAERIRELEQRNGYLYETDGLVFGLSRTGTKIITATDVLTGYRVLDGMTFAGTAEKLSEMPMSWKASIYKTIAEMNSRGDWESLEPGVRTLGGDKVLHVIGICKARRPYEG